MYGDNEPHPRRFDGSQPDPKILLAGAGMRETTPRSRLCAWCLILAAITILVVGIAIGRLTAS